MTKTNQNGWTREGKIHRPTAVHHKTQGEADTLEEQMQTKITPNTNALIKGQLKNVRIKLDVQGQGGRQMRECRWVGWLLRRVLPLEDSRAVT